jgi:DNA-binding ferritin-like protein
MPKSFSKNNKPNMNKTMKNRVSSGSSLVDLQKEITIVFLEILLMIKLYHWKTTSYATHKATDELYTKLNANIDSFIEVLLGKTGVRTNLMSKTNIKLIDLNSPETLKREIAKFKSYLVNLDNVKALKTMSNTDLFNIRDTILGDMNQFLYLLTFK